LTNCPAFTTGPAVRPSATLVIFSAGLLCGVLDIAAAFITWAIQGIPPVVILKGIAGGMLGLKAFHGGAGTAALGGVLHFLIAFSAAGVFYGASRKLRFMVRRPILAGVLYGIAVYIFMYWVVLPLSRDYRSASSISRTIVAVLTHIVCVGLPISLVVRRYSR
jgi:hypothetical protein